LLHRAKLVRRCQIHIDWVALDDREVHVQLSVIMERSILYLANWTLEDSAPRP
jgi:hypothetical protein